MAEVALGGEMEGWRGGQAHPLAREDLLASIFPKLPLASKARAGAVSRQFALAQRKKPTSQGAVESLYEEGRLQREFMRAHDSAVTCITTVPPDEQPAGAPLASSLVTGGADGRVRFSDGSFRRHSREGSVDAVAHASSEVVVSVAEGEARVWRRGGNVRAFGEQALDVRCDSDGRANLLHPGGMRIHDICSGSALANFGGDGQSCLCMDADEGVAAVGMRGRRVRLFDVRCGDCLVAECHDNPSALHLQCNRGAIFVGTHSGSVSALDLRKPDKPLASSGPLSLPHCPVRSVLQPRYLRRGVLSVCRSGGVQLLSSNFERRTIRSVRTIIPPHQTATALDSCASLAWFASALSSGHVRIARLVESTASLLD